ncbi:MAG: uroporphyrinogen-III C-methyltransferase [Candidatus Adiutrix sp.]|jgi:uroporphyrinogen III methyltransferase/synthase|nr:uroporphyrinogen-III C-methyltransferase [Candidatus Adiutrix sp.]
MTGTVYLVGAGPGDPGLLTLRASELIKTADALIYDYLAAPEILKLAPAGCRLIYVGKKSGCHALPQEEINRLLVREARSGGRVVRLKGGDPYVFGRGGEEALELARAGLPFQVVPGVSSTVAAAAYAGIPLTHRGLSSQAALITGHESPDKTASAHDWAALAKMGTLVMVMGVAGLEFSCQALIRAGRAADTPAALIQWGTTPRQRTVAASLADLPARARAAGLGAPAVLVVGEVARLRPELGWFEKLPLFGRRLLVTRGQERAGRLAALLSELGAEVWARPVIATASLAETGIFNDLSGYDWLVFTSPTGAEIFLRGLMASGRDVRALGAMKIAVIGPGTAEALAPFGLRADLMPAEHVAEGLLAALAAAGLAGRRVLLARAKAGRDVLPEGLARAGAQVRDLPLYLTFHPDWDEPLPGRPDLTTFTSSSTAEGLAARVPEAERALFPAASIGPVTTRTARRLGFPVAVEAETSTLPGLVEAVIRHFGRP